MNITIIQAHSGMYRAITPAELAASARAAHYNHSSSSSSSSRGDSLAAQINKNTVGHSSG